MQNMRIYFFFDDNDDQFNARAVEIDDLQRLWPEGVFPRREELGVNIGGCQSEIEIEQTLIQYHHKTLAE